MLDSRTREQATVTILVNNQEVIERKAIVTADEDESARYILAAVRGMADEIHRLMPCEANSDIVGRYLRMHASWSDDSGVRTERVTLRAPASIVSTGAPAGWEMRVTGPGVYDALGGQGDEIEVTFRRVAVKRDGD